MLSDLVVGMLVSSSDSIVFELVIPGHLTDVLP